MKDYKIRIEPFEMLDITAFNGNLEVNKHGEITFTGTIPQNNEDEYIAKAVSTTEVSVYAVNTLDGNEELFFKGVITSLEINADHEVKTLTTTIKTGTYLMDVTEHIRSYQDPGMTYDTVLSSYTNNYPSGDFLMKKGNGTPINNLILQYRETDWNFTRRLASHFNTVLIPDYKTGGTKYYFGISDSGSVINIKTNSYRIMKDTEEYDFKSKNGLNIHELDTVYYILKERAIYNLGDCITLNGKPLYISKIKTTLEGSELYHYYHMKLLNGFGEIKHYNFNSIGSAFYANILSVEKDEVQISIQRDENAGGEGFCQG